jgi:hypothetical protein
MVNCAINTFSTIGIYAVLLYGRVDAVAIETNIKLWILVKIVVLSRNNRVFENATFFD